MAVAADQIFVKIPARGLKRALARRPFVERMRARSFHLRLGRKREADAIFAVRVPERRRFAVEYDRLTEGFEVLTSKISAYNRGLRGFSCEAVVIVTERERQFDLLIREIRNTDVRVLVTTLDELQATGIFNCRFRELPHGAELKILELPNTEDAEEDIKE